MYIFFFHRTIPSNSSMDKSQYISMKVEHIMVIAGFCIGFGMVVCVAIVYFRFKPMDRFKNNPRQAVDNTSLSSGNSSFLPQTDSRLTSLTASPLLSQAQSPLLPIRENTTNNNSALTSPILTGIIQRPTIHIFHPLSVTCQQFEVKITFCTFRCESKCPQRSK